MVYEIQTSASRDLKRVTSKDIEPIVEHYFRFFPNREDRLWFWLVWRCLDQVGKTVYLGEEEELRVRGFVLHAAIIFKEFCGRAGFPDLGQYLDGMGEQISIDLGPSKDEINQSFEIVFEAPVQVLGSDEFWQETWLALELGLLGSAVTTPERHRRFCEALRRVYENAPSESSSYTFFVDGGLTVDTLENLFLQIPEGD